MDAPTDPLERPRAARWLPAGCLRGKTAVVTGGGTGLGLELSRGLAALGAHVAIASRSTEHHATLQGEAAQRGWSVSSHALDVREAALVQTLADELRERHGRVDMLVNNAAGNFVCPAERLSVNAWRSVLGIVLDGTFYCSKAFGRGMIADGGGSILNIVATYAWTGMPGVVHSASAKAGVLAMTKTLAAEWARHSIRVNAIAPGPFESEGAGANLWPDEASRAKIEQGIPLRRFGTAEEMAAHCLYLLSPASDYVTGECLVVDGGGSLAQPFWDAGARFSRKRSAREDGAE